MILYQKTFLLYITFALILFACGTKKELPIAAKPNNIIKNFQTDLVINYRLDKTGIKDTFNNAINEAFKGSFDLAEYDVKIALSKPKDANVEIEGKSMLVIVPVAVQVTKKTFLTDLNAKGVLEMSFVTDTDIDSLWNFKTLTKLSHHRWVEKPKLSVAGLNIPIETISNFALNKSKTTIENSIDQAVKDNFTLKSKMKENMTMFDQPFRLDTSLSAWLSIKPEEFRLNKVINNKFSALGKIQIKGVSTFTTYKPAPFKVSDKLPKIFWSEAIPDSSIFRLVADIKTMDINPVINANLNGKTFSEGDKSITLSNIMTNCDYEYFRVVSDVSGTVNGTLIIKGKPKYDAVKNEFYMEDVDMDIKTKNVIHKAAAWIAQGKIRKELESKLRFSVQSFLSEAQKNIDSQLKTFKDKYDIEMKVGLGSADVENFELKPGQIEAVLKTKFHLEMRIKDFKSFGKF